MVNTHTPARAQTEDAYQGILEDLSDIAEALREHGQGAIEPAAALWPGVHDSWPTSSSRAGAIITPDPAYRAHVREILMDLNEIEPAELELLTAWLRQRVHGKGA